VGVSKRIPRKAPGFPWPRIKFGYPLAGYMNRVAFPGFNGIFQEDRTRGSPRVAPERRGGQPRRRHRRFTQVPLCTGQFYSASGKKRAPRWAKGLPSSRKPRTPPRVRPARRRVLAVQGHDRHEARVRQGLGQIPASIRLRRRLIHLTTHRLFVHRWPVALWTNTSKRDCAPTILPASRSASEITAMKLSLSVLRR